MAEEKKDKSLSALSLTQEDKKWAENMIKKADKPVEYIETGDIGLDLALTDGNGLPMGSSILFWAKPGCGKTTVVVDACKRLIQKAKATKKPFKTVYIGVEDSKGLISSLGMDEYIESGDFLYISGQLCWRQIEIIYTLALRGEGKFKDVKLIAIDSINNVLSDQNMKASVADGDFGTKARERSNFYSKFLPLCKEKGISSFFISQVRQKQGATQFEDPNKAAVSNADLHNVDIIIKCTSSLDKLDASKVEETTIFGKDKVDLKRIFKMDSKATDCKNRYIKGNAVEILYEKGKQVHNYYVLRKLLEGNKLVTKPSAGWWTINKELCESFKLPSKEKMRTAELNEILQAHAGELVEFLKKAGMYKVGISEIEVAVTDEDIEEEQAGDGEE